MWSEGSEGIVGGRRKVKELGRRVYGNEGEYEVREVKEGEKCGGRVVKGEGGERGEEEGRGS